MARKTEHDEQEVVAVTAEPVAEPKAPETRYTLLTWGVHPMWRCTVCPWDTVESEAAMLEHYQREHVAAVPLPAVHIPVYDRWGNLVR